MTTRIARLNRAPQATLMVLALALSSPPAAAAQAATSLNFVDADLRGVIRSLSTMLGINVLVSEEVPDTRVTYQTATPVAPRDIGPVLEAILEAQGLVLVNRGPVAQVMTIDAAPPSGPVSTGRTLPSPPPVGLITHIVPLESISTVEALEVLDRLAGPISRFEALPRSNAVMITEHASNVARLLELLAQLDEANGGEASLRTYVHPLRHASAVELATTLSEVYGTRLATPSRTSAAQAISDQSLSSTLSAFRQRELDAIDQRRAQPLPTLTVEGGPAAEPVTLPPSSGGDPSSGTIIVPDPATNSIIIRTEPVNLTVLLETIAELDVRPPQVLLEVQVLEVTLDEATQYGIDWFMFTRQDDVDATARLGTQAFSDSALAGVQDFVLRAVSLGDVDVRAVIRALASSAEVRVLSTPHVVAVNNQQARILVGSQVPFTQSTRTGLDVVVDQVVQYRNVGVQLSVIPTINADGYVSFRLLQEVNALTKQNVEAALGASVISTREAETSAVVRNSQTVVIGGLIDESDESVESGVPLLKDIPLLGYFFKSVGTRRLRTELAIFVTPYVITSDEDAQRIYERVRSELDPEMLAAPDTSGTGGNM